MENDMYLRVNMSALATVGLWPLHFKKRSYLNKIHQLFSVFVMIYFALFVCTEYVEIGNRLSESIFEIINNLSVSLLYTVTILKMKITKSEQVQRFVRQIRETEDIIMNGSDEDLKTIFKQHITWNHRLNRMFISLTSGTILPFFINPIITEMTNPIGNFTEIIGNRTVYVDRPLPFSSWFPFDKYKYYYTSFSLQIVAGTLGAALTCTTDIFFWGFMIFGISQIKILQYKLKNINRDGEIFAKENNIGVDDGVTFVLRKCVLLHQIIIKYFFELDRSVNFLMLLDFGICSMQIGAIGFQVVVTGFGWSQVFAMEYLMAMLIQMFLFYWHANEILLESVNLSSAIWESNFYECSPRIQKSLQFMMMRSQQPLTLHVGPFYAMSTATALSIVRAAYSYVALMRQVYS